MTGHVAYSLDCERWRHGCGSCPYLEEYPRLRRDTTAILWRLKRSVYARSRLHDRRALALAARPRAREPAPRAVPGAAHPERDRHDDLLARLEAGGARAAGSAARPAARLLRGGRPARATQGAAPARAGTAAARGPAAAPARRGTGRRRKESSRACSARSRTSWCSRDAYRAADVFAVPTLADVLAQTAQESIACGTPCVVVRPRRRDRGRPAPRDRATRRSSADVDALARGSRDLLGRRRADRERSSARCREVADARVRASTSRCRRYVELYDEVLAAA